MRPACWRLRLGIANFQRLFRRDAKTNTPEARAPQTQVARAELQRDFARHETSRDSSHFRFHRRIRANAFAVSETSFHFRRHDEAAARRRAGAVSEWQMGGVRLRRCRPRGEYEDFAFVDCGCERR